MPFGIIGRTGPGMRQVVGFGDRSTGRGILLGANLRRAIVTNGDFRRTCRLSRRRGPLPKLLWVDLFIHTSDQCWEVSKILVSRYVS